MPETSSPPSTVSRAALRVVLFGMPDAGKSSLLGALAQAGQTQEHLLNGHLTDLGQGLTELQHRLYDERPKETLEEVVPYPATFEPFAGQGVDKRRLEVLFIDCDGRVANELLSRRRSLEGDGSEQSLAAQIEDAETLVLVIDAAASPAQVDADLAEFGRFLRLLQLHRGRHSEVGGLPVFLALSKCDLLAQAGDSPAAWMERIEERKRQVSQRFKDLLAEQPGSLTFGSLDLHLWATAVKRPELAGSPARPREPYGVAELFRQCLDEAQAYSQRQRVAGRRLAWTVTGTVGVVASMVALGVVLATSSPTGRTTPLQSTVQQYRDNEAPTASARLREPLQQKISVLTELTSDADFTKLPPDLQTYVSQRLQELRAYQAFKDKLTQARGPEQARSDKELDAIRTRLEDELVVPEPYRGEWAQTEAVLLREQQLADARALHNAVDQVEQWYRNLRQRGDELWKFTDLRPASGPIPWNIWYTNVRRLLADAAATLFAPNDRVPGARGVTYATVLRFERAAEARDDWDKRKQALELLSELTAALGLPGAAALTPPTLQIRAENFTIEQARSRLRELEKSYPNYQKWLGLTLPDAAEASVHRTARGNYERALVPAQEIILRQLQQLSPDGRETPERWRALRDWLAKTQDLAGWRELATLLAGLADLKAGDPVAELLAFLKQDHFELELRGLTLTIPDSLKARPVGNLIVYARAGDNPAVTYKFAPTGEPQHDPIRGLTRYTYALDNQAGITYKPGDGLWAELGLTKDSEGRERSLRWYGSRSLIYQMDRLHRPPRVLRKEQKETEGPIADGVVLTVSPEGGVPKVPDLVPVVILKKR
jgi:50S ribosome-binding GTPase